MTTGIIFNGEMVRAILDGRKTQTRRVFNPRSVLSFGQKQVGFEYCKDANLWRKDYPVENMPRLHVPVRHPDDKNDAWTDCGCNTFHCPYGGPGDQIWVRETWHPHKSHSGPVSYRATWDDDDPDEGWKPSIFMPRWASRITLEIVSVRVERVQDIGKDGRQAKDVLAEGITPEQIDHWAKWLHKDDAPAHTFGVLWDSINAKRGFGWSVNPWVWKITFKRIN